ncbi:hypothetical protein AAON49_01275 [Pseudotenacibaculum sp. MALMAid0570]|uniref:hypothetical protein n=1 Tax=Pseudotenacibaculum sp. MALMAid0570 TaxID=3143938 RepID=UPI0032DE77FA
MHTTISHPIVKNEPLRLNPFKRINLLIEKEKTNSIGISIALIMFGTGIASITAALAVDKSFFIVLMLATILAMGSNVMAISQRSFKTVVWSFIINILVNVALIIYLLVF